MQLIGFLKAQKCYLRAESNLSKHDRDEERFEFLSKTNITQSFFQLMKKTSKPLMKCICSHNLLLYINTFPVTCKQVVVSREHIRAGACIITLTTSHHVNSTVYEYLTKHLLILIIYICMTARGIILRSKPLQLPLVISHCNQS